MSPAPPETALDVASAQLDGVLRTAVAQLREAEQPARSGSKSAGRGGGEKPGGGRLADEPEAEDGSKEVLQPGMDAWRVVADEIEAVASAAPPPAAAPALPSVAEEVGQDGGGGSGGLVQSSSNGLGGGLGGDLLVAKPSSVGFSSGDGSMH